MYIIFELLYIIYCFYYFGGVVMVHPIYDSKMLRKATDAYFQKDWAAML